MQQHSLHGKTLFGWLAIACLSVVLHACGMDAGEQANPGGDAGMEGDAEAQPAEGSADGPVHWSYEGDTGAGQWGSLDPSFAVCEGGMRQSPIDLVGTTLGGESELEILWQPSEVQVVDNGHTIQVDVAEGSAVMLDDRRFSLLQFHFHLPSEHTVEGSAAPMEVHFVHQAEEGDLGVIGVFMNSGDADPAIQSLWDAIPGSGESPTTLADFDPRSLLPAGEGRFRYAGSLTTPPCSEIVSWVVMTEPISVSPEQVDAFRALYPMNARPVQPLFERVIQLRD